MKNYFIVIVLLLVSANITVAQEFNHLNYAKSSVTGAQVTYADQGNVVMSTGKYNALPQGEQNRISGIFNLKPKEYATYLHYMNDTMDGYEYQKNINPNIILAIHAGDGVLRQHYLSNAVKADHRAVSNMLKVSVDYTKTVRQLYPNEKPIMTPAMQAAVHNHLNSDDTVQLFCRPEGAVCGDLLGVIMKPTLQSNGARLDLFFVGNVKRQDIVKFAKSNNIAAKNVLQRRITLNFGNKPFKALETEAHHKLPLPYLIVRRDGKSIPVDLGGKSA